MLTRRIFALLAPLATTTCTSINKKDVELNLWEKCKPVQQLIINISQTNRFNAVAVKEIFRKYKSNPICNDGFYAEGFSEIVTKSLANDFLNVISLVASDKDMSEFLIKSINGSANWKDLDLVEGQANVSCPANAIDLCEVLAATSKEASKNAK